MSEPVENINLRVRELNALVLDLKNASFFEKQNLAEKIIEKNVEILTSISSALVVNLHSIGQLEKQLSEVINAR